jgi:hypothetical protein
MAVVSATSQSSCTFSNLPSDECLTDDDDSISQEESLLLRLTTENISFDEFNQGEMDKLMSRMYNLLSEITTRRDIWIEKTERCRKTESHPYRKAKIAISHVMDYNLLIDKIKETIQRIESLRGTM